MHSSNPPSGWVRGDPRPLSTKPNFRSLDAPCNSEFADPNQPKDPELFKTAQTVVEAMSRIHELPAECGCGVRFQGDTTERRYTIIAQQGDGREPEARTLCGLCYDKCGLPAPAPEESHQTRLIRFAHEAGSTQTEIAALFGLTQSTVSRTLARIRRGK